MAPSGKASTSCLMASPRDNEHGAWVLRHEHVIAIPKSSKPERVRENVQAAGIILSAEDLMDLDREFPPPRKAQPLAMT
jgi:diketogulonate reductase-like aldo/keto reductase